MNHARRSFAVLIAVAVGVASGCTASSVLPSTRSGLEPSAAPTAVSAPTPPPLPSTATPDLGGLEARPHMPPLVDGEVDGCLPLCRGFGIVDIAIPAGRYQTQNFFGGYMTASFADGWKAGEDSTGEFKVFGPIDDEYGTAFAVDVYPVLDLERVKDVPNTAAAIVDWLRKNPYLVVSEPQQAKIGDLPATAVDIRLTDGAPTEADDCGAPCVGFIGFEQWTDVNGIRGDDVYRFLWSDVTYSGTPHVLSMYVEGRDAAHLKTMLEAVEPIVESVTVPARPAGSS